ncbi:MAG: retinol dehydrogenase [Acidobacteria bacterium]|nr:MAG: retinol dehydrogenase [Acidobacteriota bacterium]
MSKQQKPVVLVTGAVGAIGYAISRQLAERGYCVHMAARNQRVAEKMVEDLVAVTGNQSIQLELVDLSVGSSIEELADRWRGPLHCLINNAATTPRSRTRSPEGLELQFATNILGYVRMMLAFEEVLKQSRPARVVNVASYWAGDLDLDDLQFTKRAYDNDCAYRQSKQADRMLSVAFAERWRGQGISVNACHPGDVPSKLARNLGFGGHQTPDSGAATPVWLATEPVGLNRTGMYFEDQKEKRCQFSRDKEACMALYEHCLTFV